MLDDDDVPMFTEETFRQYATRLAAMTTVQAATCIVRLHAATCIIKLHAATCIIRLHAATCIIRLLCVLTICVRQYACSPWRCLIGVRNYQRALLGDVSFA
jgi:hypothetical protein